MEILVHIGLAQCGAARIQDFFHANRNRLVRGGVLYPETPGKRNHTRLFMAATNPDHVDPLRWNRGFATAEAQARLAAEVTEQLAGEVTRHKPDKLILSAVQFAQALAFPDELRRLHAMLEPHGTRFRIIAHVDEQARVAAAFYGEQVLDGRIAPLTAELDAAQREDWRDACLREWADADPTKNAMPEIQAPPFWLDYEALVTSWEEVFGAGSVDLRAYDRELFHGSGLDGEIAAAFGLSDGAGGIEPAEPERPPSAAWLARARELNQCFQATLHAGRIIPRQLWRRLLGQAEVPGDPVDPGSLHALSRRFAASNRRLLKAHPHLTRACLKPDSPAPDWHEADPGRGFRASQYMVVFLPVIDRTTAEERERKQEALAALSGRKNGKPALVISDAAERLLPPLARENLIRMHAGRFAPHDRIGRVNEAELAAPYPEVPRPPLPDGSTGRVIVSCMKNEAPYIIEWIAYHRCLGIDNFLIYTNACEDGTDTILQRLQALGLVQHRRNDNWKGNSPQQHALNQSLAEPVVTAAEWIVHIDVDEFINVRVGDGTLGDFLDRVPEATNVAMTWRLFGNSGVTRFRDEPVIAQFDRCAPKFCPKPHTVWGFKTMTRNIGAYEKLSCHRPNKLRPDRSDDVHWVNGSGQPMGEAIKQRGWRSEMRSVGYDLIQLNHYPLRSADSFLIKRQRGRALHVNRTIGLNYWIRMDWDGATDVTIQRNLPRLRAEMDRLLADPKLARLHRRAVAWHQAKAEELRATPEFSELCAKALAARLTPMERVAYSLALDMES